MAENTTPRVIRAEKAFAPTTDPTQAKGHIIQADWAQEDASKMDYIHNKPKIPSLEELNKQQIKIVNRSGKVYTSQIRVGDLNWTSDLSNPQGGEDLTWGCDYAPVELPTETNDSTTYTINIYNVPSSISYGADFPVGIGVCKPKELMGPNTFYDEYYSEVDGETIWSADWRDTNNYNKACLYYDHDNYDSVTIKNVTWTGPWAVLCGESSGEYFDLYKEFEDSIIEYSFIKEESDEEALGPVHDIDLHSNTEVHYDFPVTELTINTLHKCFSDNINQQWVVSFIAGDIDPIVIVPESVNNKPVKWINGKPQFRSNKKYMLTFKEITDTFYIETKLLSEDKTCGQWILCPYDNQSEGATYGNTILHNLALSNLVRNLQENEMFEIIGGKITFVANAYVHPDYEATQGNITIPNAPNIRIENCIGLKIWKIRKSTSTTELEVHVFGTYIPSSEDTLPNTSLCTDSIFYLVLSEYLSGCITGGGNINDYNYSLIKYSNIL